MGHVLCPVCRTRLSQGLTSWHEVCDTCAYESATLTPNINLEAAHTHIDEISRESGLKELRISNFEKLINEIRLFKNRGALLEIGCAHEWFLERAKSFFDVCGVEPDQNIYAGTRIKGLNVRLGYFPDVLKAGEIFDVIVFNDVLEHIPDVNGVLDACRQHLRDTGILVINLPNSKGLFYQVSKLLCRLTVTSFFERLWQKGLPSPHVHYFDKENLARLLRSHDMVVRKIGRLSTVEASSLYKRVAYIGSESGTHNLLVFLGVLLLFPVMLIFPSDIVYFIAEKK
jgi:2-polyprenyl-3-methyl-5-hydroxy-6-metoxy-1,4-benzoquinol methylase